VGEAHEAMASRQVKGKLAVDVNCVEGERGASGAAPSGGHGHIEQQGLGLCGRGERHRRWPEERDAVAGLNRLAIEDQRSLRNMNPGAPAGLDLMGHGFVSVQDRNDTDAAKLK
jgi:hypothetical protein